MDKRTIKITGPSYLDSWSVELDINNPLVKGVLEQLVAFKRLATVTAAYTAKQEAKAILIDGHPHKNHPWQPGMLSPYLELRRTEYGDTWRHISSSLALQVGKATREWLLNTGEYPRVARFTGKVYGCNEAGGRMSIRIEPFNAVNFNTLFIERDAAIEQRKARQALGHQLSAEHEGGVFLTTLESR